MRDRDSVHALVVHDHQAFADALCAAIQRCPQVAASAAVRTIDDAYEAMAAGEWDVVVLDALPAEVAALGGAAEILRRWPDVRVVLVAAASEVDVLAEAAAVGVDAFLPSEASLAELIDAVVTDDPSELGQSALLAVAAEHIRRREFARDAAPVVDLTPREREILGLLAQGVAMKDMAGLLGIKLETCRGYVKSLLLKLGARSQLQAVVFAAREGLLDDVARAEVPAE
jgi:DNA-binding NarL/FixJ family response regulator